VQTSPRVQRLTVLTLLAAGLVAGLALHRFWRRELSHVTGAAQWIWVTDTLEKAFPTAGLFVTSFRLDAPVSSALLKVCGDREYVVYVNGTPAACGWSRPGFRLDMFDVAHLLHQGDNVVAVEVRSPTPVGGLLFALDLPGRGANAIVSGPEFVSRQHFSLAAHDPTDRPAGVDWGDPPRRPWGYPEPLSHPRTLVEAVVEDPVRVDHTRARPLPRGGWVFRLPRPVYGYLWLEADEDGPLFVATTADPHADPARMRGVVETAVRLRGQRRWLDPQPRRIAAVYAFGRRRPSAVEVWPLSEEFSSGAPGVVPGTHGPEQRTRWTIRRPPE
jgi:hypothetical protein